MCLDEKCKTKLDDITLVAYYLEDDVKKLKFLQIFCSLNDYIE